MRLRLARHSLSTPAIILFLVLISPMPRTILFKPLNRPILFTKRISLIRQSAGIIRLLSRVLKTVIYIIIWPIVILRRENWVRPFLIMNGPES